MKGAIPALLLLMFPSFSFTKQVVTFASGGLTLHGIVFRPEGKGPFPAVLYNHGSYKDPTEAIEILGPVFASRGWVLFAPYRRGQAANDYDLSPSRELSAAMKNARKAYEVKIYPAYGASPEEGHSFAYRGSSVWANDVFAFFEEHCNRVP